MTDTQVLSNDDSAVLITPEGATAMVLRQGRDPEGRSVYAWQVSAPGMRNIGARDLSTGAWGDHGPVAMLRTLLHFAEHYRDGGDGDPISKRDRRLGEWFDYHESDVADFAYPPDGGE